MLIRFQVKRYTVIPVRLTEMGNVARGAARVERHERNMTLVAAGAGLVGALLGGGLRLGGTYVPAQESREQSQADFLRTQRQEAYANFLVTARENLRQAREQRATIEVSDIAGARSRASTNIADLADAAKARQAPVLMLGTPEVARLSDDVSLGYTLLVSYAFAFADARESGQGVDDARRNVERAEDKVSADIDAFTAAARSDLGVETNQP